MSKNFRVNIIIRILILCVLIGLFIYFVFVDLRWLRSIYLGLFIIISIIEFVWYVDRTNRDFTTFLLALLQNDFTTTFSESDRGKSFNNLYKAFNQITKRFENLSSAKEVQHLYLEGLVEHVRVGIISFDKQEKIHLMNQAMKNILDRPQAPYLNNIQNVNPELIQLFRDIKPKETRLLKHGSSSETLQLSVHASEFILDSEYHKLISVQNIKNELDANELDAWQKLIRVLTHEIMNSVTPITSLSDSLRTMLQNSDGNLSMSKFEAGLDAIYARSTGLQGFTESYRKLTRIPIPKMENVSLNHELDQLLTLLTSDLRNVKLKVNIQDDLQVLMDKDLMNQVFINLIKNAIDAVNETQNPSIEIKAFKQEEVIIEIIDNGSGIDADKIDQIFVPFFTTKENGSGIGLALCRQIVRLHNGTITASSVAGSTVFKIVL